MSNNITFAIKLDNGNFNQGAQEGERAIGSLERTMISANTKAALLADGIKEIAKKAVELGKDFFETGVAMQKPWDDLGTSMRGRGQDLELVRKRVEDFTGSLGKLKGVDDEALVSVLAELVKGGRDVEAAMGQTNLVLDVAARHHLQLSESAELVNKAYQGNVKGIKALGVQWVESTNDMENARRAQEALATSVAGAHDQMMERNPAVAMEVAMMEMKDTFVKEVFPSIKDGVKFVSETINSLDAEKVKAFAADSAEGIATLIDATTMAGDALKNLPGMGKSAVQAITGSEKKAANWRDRTLAKGKAYWRAGMQAIDDWMGLQQVPSSPSFDPDAPGRSAQYIMSQLIKVNNLEAEAAQTPDALAPERLLQNFAPNAAGTSGYQTLSERINALRSNAKPRPATPTAPVEVSPIVAQRQREELQKKAREEVLAQEQALSASGVRFGQGLQIQSPMRLQVVKVGGMHGSRGSGR